MKKLGVAIGLFACVLFVGFAYAAEPGRLVKGRYVQECVDLPIASFTRFDTEITSATAPNLALHDSVMSIEWADGETSPAYQTYQVPQDYNGDGGFLVFATEDDSTTPNKVDFDVYVNRDGAAADTSATNQTPVALDQTASISSVVRLTPVTDFSALQGGDWVTLRVWRDDTLAGAQKLEMKGVTFCYTPIGY